MTDPKKTGSSAAQPVAAEAAWDAYWRQGGAPGHALTDSAKAGILDRFWDAALDETFAETAPRRAADLGCGSGAVAGLTLRAAARAGSALDALWCVDWSATVATRAAERLEGPARAVSADLAALPFTDGGLDLAVSQYGLEYAGEAAFSEAARVLAPGGALIALVHDSEGGVAAECRQTSAFFDEAAEIAVIPLARAAFAAGFEADRAPQRRAGLITARQALQPALARLARLVARESDATAMQFLRQVRRDLLIMLARRQAYAPEDVFGWLDKVENEIAAYRHRMASMLAAARSAAQIDQVAAIFRAAGCEVEPPRRVLAGSGAASIGWALRARRPMAGAP